MKVKLDISKGFFKNRKNIKDKTNRSVKETKDKIKSI